MTKQKRRGMLIIVSGPSGTGKGTLCERLIQQDEHIGFSVSATTRAPCGRLLRRRLRRGRTSCWMWTLRAP